MSDKPQRCPTCGSPSSGARYCLMRLPDAMHEHDGDCQWCSDYWHTLPPATVLSHGTTVNTWAGPSPVPVQSAEPVQSMTAREFYFSPACRGNTIENKFEFAEAYAASLHSNPDLRWIPVSERLPVEGEVVIVLEDGTVGTNYIPYSNTVPVDCRYRWRHGHDYVTHWMPLPDPPTTKERE